jgi:orotidine-5'-phosphate decarboxylase
VNDSGNLSAFRKRLEQAIARAGAPLCIGLDPDPAQIPPYLGTGIEACGRFLAAVIDATRDLVAAFKANTAFFEAYGPDGIRLLEGLRDRIGPEILLIADAKRGDVLHTNEAAARFLFGRVRADAVTVQPYLGGEPLLPFCRDPVRGMFVLCVTSNPGARDVQELATSGGPLYLEIARQTRTWSRHPNVGLVLGTTKPESVAAVLDVAADLPLLLPGGGAQGGNTRGVFALLKERGACGLFTYSRSVLYASRKEDFAHAARAEAKKVKMELL